MGFFGSFNAIGKIYSHLCKIEPMFNELMAGQRAMNIRKYSNVLASFRRVLPSSSVVWVPHFFIFGRNTSESMLPDNVK